MVIGLCSSNGVDTSGGVRPSQVRQDLADKTVVSQKAHLSLENSLEDLRFVTYQFFCVCFSTAPHTEQHITTKTHIWCYKLGCVHLH